ncbi:RING finger protein [Crotalus adamanteus]|uniref:RING finger protein n=1 Tax=Crotalus adamanteus TaxID=8729 RepID=A0AAW1C3P1_CROAD
MTAVKALLNHQQLVDSRCFGITITIFSGLRTGQECCDPVEWNSLPCLPGAPFQRSQHPHATSCRHFHLAPQPQISADFPLPHAVQPHLPAPHQHSSPLHSSLPTIPTLPFQDVTGPPFLPQALHQQYLLQQRLMEAQHHRRIISHPRRTQEHMSVQPHRLHPSFEFGHQLQTPRTVAPQPRYLAEGTDWDLSVDAGLGHNQFQVRPVPQHYQHYLASQRMHHFPQNTSSTQMVSQGDVSGDGLRSEIMQAAPEKS